MVTIQKIRSALTSIKTNEGSDIVSAGLARNIQVNGPDVSIDLLAPSTETGLADKVRGVVQQIDGVENVTIQTQMPQATQSRAERDNLSNVKHIIAVSSCKGGVGKSTVAAHLAKELARQGYKTGLADADIYGPSVPTLFNIAQPQIKTTDQNFLIPIELDRLKLMSFGFLLGDAPAVMRGPIVTRYIQQMLLFTQWGELDYLIIDMPPGTGDIHLTITQTIRLTGAVIVTTPHTLSLIDVARGILMFEKVNVPIVGIIENMSYFAAPGTGEKHYLFGQSNTARLQEQFGIDVLAEIPVLPELSQASGLSQSNPFIQQAAKHMEEQLQKRKDSDNELPEISADEIEIHLRWKEKKEDWRVNNRELRLNSQDALSVDEMSGKRKIKAEDIRTDIAPKQIIPVGNYAINVVWNDGHSAGIYPYPLIERLAKKQKV